MPYIGNMHLIHTDETLGKSLCFSKTQFPMCIDGFLSGNGMYLYSMSKLVGHNGRVTPD